MTRHRIVLAFVGLLVGPGYGSAHAADTITQLGAISVSAPTADKPQSKLWFHAGTWWGVFPSKTVKPAGTWVWRLGPSKTWSAVTRLSTATDTRSDAKQMGDVVHVIMDGASPQLASIQYDPGTDTYVPWSVRPTLTPVSLPGNETVTLDVDSTGRMWLSTETSSQVHVFWDDAPYDGPFGGPIVLDNHIKPDDITMVTALPVMLLPDGNIGQSIGVFWSNQNTERFGFRLHRDGTDPTVWLADESPAHQSALNGIGTGFSDDHMNFAIASDGTIYAAIKTSYNSPNEPLIALLVRRPNVLAPQNPWDDLYEVDRSGTRPCALLNEAAGTVQVAYTTASGGGNIVMKESPIDHIAFPSSRRTLLTGTLNDVTSTKDNWTDQVVLVASGKAAMITHDVGVTTTTVATTTTSTTTTSTVRTTSTTAPGATTTSTTTTVATTTTSTTLATGTTTNSYQAGVSGPAGSASVDANIRLSTLTTNYGTDPSLYVGVTNGPDKIYRTLMAFDLSNIPAGAVITSCKLTVNVTQRTNPTAGHVRRLCAQHWLDGDGQGENQATWSQWKTGSAWGSPGADSSAPCTANGDYTTDAEVAYVPPAGTGAFTFPDLSGLCQNAIDQATGRLRLRITQDSEATQSNLIKFDSSDASTAANRPKLVVTWH